MIATVYLPLLFVLIIIVLIFWAGFSFAKDIAEILINGVILYLLYFRSLKYFKPKHQEYIIAAVVSILILTLLGNFLPIWWITSFALFSFILAQLLLFIKK